MTLHCQLSKFCAEGELTYCDECDEYHYDRCECGIASHLSKMKRS